MSRQRTITPINGATFSPVIPAKSQEQLLLETGMLEAELERLKLENEALRNRPNNGRRLSCKVSPKGALSVYGLGRFPVTLYQEQWQVLLAASDEIKAFITANSSDLSVKGEN